MSREAAAAATAMTLAAILMTTGAKAENDTIGDGRAAQLAQAQTAPGDGVRTFDIPPQPLGSALNAFGRQAGLQVSIEASVASGVQVQGVSGTMRPEQALNQLLAGTGIVARFTPDRGFILSRPNLGGAMQLDPLNVQGAFPVPSQAMIDNLPPPYAGGQVATGGQLGLLGNRSVMDTPFNQTNYTAKNIRDQQAQNIRDVLIDDPSARAISSERGPGVQNMTLRGFPLVNGSVAFNGLYGLLPFWSTSPELAERVEVLKGPSVMLNGMPPSGSIGGTINVVPKRAPDEPLTQVTAGYASAAQFGGHADLARRFGSDKQFGVRFNGAFRAGQTPVQWNAEQLGLASLGLDFRGERVRLSADLGYQYQYINGLQPTATIGAGVVFPGTPKASNNFGQPWTYNERKDLFGVVRGEVDLTEHITAYAAFGALDDRSLYLSGGTAAINNVNGNTTQTPLVQSSYRQAMTGEVGLRGEIDTGPISHAFSVGATTFSLDVGSVSVNGRAYASSIYNPTIIGQPSIPTPAANKVSSQGLSSLGMADTLSAADKRIQLTVGARLQQVTAANFNATTGAQTSNYDQSALSPSVALVFKPWQNVSVYGNWIQGLQQGTIVGPTFTNAGEIFPPYKSTQYEAGVKVDWGRFTTTASVFQISQPSTITNVATNTLMLAGEQRNQGLEFNVFGEPIEGVRLLGGVMFLNAVLAKTQGGLTDGWIAPFSPTVNLNLAGEWDLPFVRGLTLNGRVIYTDSQYIDTTWPRRSLPEWTRFDLGARYTFDNPVAKGKLLVARFNVENVLDANYWVGSGNLLYLGEPRTFRLSLTADF